MAKDEALKMALEALEKCRDGFEYTRQYVGYKTLPAIEGWSWYDGDVAAQKAITAIREALAQPEQEPDAPDIVVVDDSNSQTNTMSWAINLPLPIGTPLYTSPPAKPWVGLTPEDIWDTKGYKETREMYHFARTIEAKLKEKNT